MQSRYTVSLLLGVLIGCQTTQTVGGNDSSITNTTIVQLETEIREDNDRPIINLASDYATSDASRRDLAWKQLSRYPRGQLVKELTRLRDKTVGNERVAIVFLLCNLDADYSTNRRLLVQALEKSPHSANTHADWLAALVGRLIRRGDSTLLSVLFQASTWSDGAMATELSAIFEERLVAKPNSFVAQLTTVTKKTRERVYAHLTDETLTREQINRTLTRLHSIRFLETSAGRHKREVVRELSTVLAALHRRIRP